MEKEEKDIRFVARFYRENRLDTTQAWQKLGIGYQQLSFDCNRICKNTVP